jgi:hypothetical protein
MALLRKVLISLVMLAMFLSAMLAIVTPTASAHALVPTAPAQAQVPIASGFIVDKTSTEWSWATWSYENYLWIQKPSITAVVFVNPNGTLEGVPNSADGVLHTPIGQRGNEYLYGVSKRWIASTLQHASAWSNPSRWIIGY